MDSNTDEYTTQKFEKSKFNFYAYLSHSHEDIWAAEIDFNVDKGWLRDGAHPDDGVGFGWDGDEFDFATDYGDGWSCNNEDIWNLAEFSGRGAAFNFRDAGHAKNFNYVFAYLRNEGGFIGTRNVIFSYVHTWWESRIKKTEINSDGTISITLTNQEKKWNNPAQEQIFV